MMMGVRGKRNKENPCNPCLKKSSSAFCPLTPFPLQPALLPVSRTGSPIFAFRRIELITQREAYPSEFGYIVAHSAYTAIHNHIHIISLQKIASLQLYAQPVFKERLVQRQGYIARHPPHIHILCVTTSGADGIRIEQYPGGQ